MSDNQLQRVEELFQAAADLPTADRAAFLEKECGGDQTLVDRVQRLLHRLDEQSSMTSPLPERDRHVGPFPAAAITEGPGATIGRYKLLQVIGEGGFGVVYMAEQQEPVVRKVALKIIKLGMDTREVIARFEAERQALAMMDHPHIAKVLDGGATNSGRPYFVMELVRGVSITEFFDKRDLDTEQRLELFLQVCGAVQHAHQKGVIHRDLKPSNVMVTLHDGVPMPKVIDFGVAKAMHIRLTDKTLFTRYEQFVGTPAYMSPEQAEMSALDIDTRTDIYSLGVLLYEILTGTTPFDTTSLRRAGLAEIQRIIREDMPPRPSLRVSTTGDATVARRRGMDVQGLCKALRGDLDWIVMKALEKDRSRRYESAGDFAEDIRRHLANVPVLAGPPSAAYRLRKFIARNRAAAVGGALVTLALIAGVIGTTTAMFQARTSANVAQEQADRTMNAVDFLLSTLSLTNPEVALSPEVTVVTLLDHTSDRVADAFANDPGAEMRVRATIGRAYARLGKNDLAEPHLRRVVEIADAMTDSETGSRAALHTAGFTDIEFEASLWALTNVCFAQNRDDSFAIANRAEEVGLDCVSEVDPTLSDLLRRFMEAVEAGAWTQEPGSMNPATALFEKAVARADESLPHGDSRWPILSDLFMAAGYTVWYTPHEEHGEAYWRKALEIQRWELPPHHPDISTTINLIVGILNGKNRTDESEALIRESLGSLRKVHRHGALAIASAEGLLGATLTLQGRYADAEPILLRSHADIKAVVKNDASYIAWESYMRVIRLYHAWEKSDEAAPYRDALAEVGSTAEYVAQWAIGKNTFSPEQAAIFDAGNRLEKKCGGISYLATKGTVEAEGVGTVFSELVTAAQKLLSPEDPRTVMLARQYIAWGNALNPEVHAEERCQMGQATYDVLRSIRSRLPLDFAESASLLATCSEANVDGEMADRYLDESLETLNSAERRGDWFIAAKEVRIARAFVANSRFEQAEQLLLQALESLRVQLGEQHRDTNTARRELYDLYLAWGKQDIAQQYRVGVAQKE